MSSELRDAVSEQARKIEEDCDRAAMRDALLSTRAYDPAIIKIQKKVERRRKEEATTGSTARGQT